MRCRSRVADASASHHVTNARNAGVSGGCSARVRKVAHVPECEKWKLTYMVKYGLMNVEQEEMHLFRV